MWCSNQLVDLLAKDSAESIRATKAFCDSLVHKEAQLADLAMFIAKLTHEANSWIGPDGVKMRDSEGLPKRLRKSRIRSKRCSRLVCKPRKDAAKKLPRLQNMLLMGVGIGRTVGLLVVLLAAGISYAAVV